MKLSVYEKVIDTSEISEKQIQEVLEYLKNYHNYSYASLCEKLKARVSHLYCFYDTYTDELIGTTAVNSMKIKSKNGRNYIATYGGMSFIHPKYRGLYLIPRVNAKFCIKQKIKYPFSTIYLWTDAIGFGSYLSCARSADTIYPSYKKETPKEMKDLIDSIGKTFYPQEYDSQTGTVKKKENRLKEHTSPITRDLLKDPDIHFYSKINPQYKKGHGLITVIPIKWSTLAHAMLKGVSKFIVKTKKRRPLKNVTN